MFFSNIGNMLQIISLTVLVYFSLVFILRIAGKRTLSEINAFDLLVTITIGSIAATTMISENTSFFDGIVAVITLVFLQYIISKLDVHFKFVGDKIISEPTLLYYNGEFLQNNMKKTRVTKKDILQQVRLQSETTITNIDAVVLESNGKLSVIKKSSNLDLEQLRSYE